MPISSNQRIEDTSCATTAIEHLSMWNVVQRILCLHLEFVLQHLRMTSPAIIQSFRCVLASFRRLLTKSARGVLATLRGSTYGREYDSPLRLLRPCWTAFLNSLQDIRVPSVIVHDASFLGRHRVCQQPVTQLGAGPLGSARSSRL
jgi:hypothetical protein